MNPFLRNQLRLSSKKALESATRKISGFFVAAKKAIGRPLTWTWTKTKEVGVSIKKVVGGLFSSAGLYVKDQWKKNARRVVEVVLYFIIIPILLFTFYVNLGVSIKELPFAKIALYGGIGLAVALLLWLSWSKRNKLVSAVRGIGSSGGGGNSGDAISRFFTSVAVFLVFNAAYWAMLSQIHGDWGSEYFTGTWLWSPAFIVLAVATLVMGFSYGRANKQFGFLRVPAAIMITVTVIMAMLPGIGGPVRPKIPGFAEASAVNYTLPRKLADAPWIVYQGPVKDSVLAAFPSDTTMWNIAAAESGFRQFDSDGVPLPNDEGSSAVGVFQIMEGLHGRDCGADLDIHTISGNIACAKILRERNGYHDWASSAWKWRDWYATEPEHWSFDRAPEYLLARSALGDEVVIVDAPVGSESIAVHTNGRKYCWSADGEGVPYLVIDDAGQTATINPGESVKLTRYARWLKFQSLGEVPLKIVFRRRPPGVMSCSTA